MQRQKELISSEESTGVAVTGSETSQGPFYTLPVLRAKTEV